MHEHRARTEAKSTNICRKLLLATKLLHQQVYPYSKIFFLGLYLLQFNSVSALYLQQQQQPPPPAPVLTSKAAQQSSIITASSSPQLDLSSNGAVIQALGQYAAQQLVGNGGQLVAKNSPAEHTIITANGGGNGGNSLIAGPANSQQFLIKVTYEDLKNNMTYVRVIPVNDTNLHEPRIELRYQSKYPFVSLDERTPNNTVVAAVVVNDEDTGPNGETSLAIEQGNELGHFKLVSTTFTNTIQVNGAPLSKHRQAEYNLTIVARDHGSPPKSSSSNLVIRLHASPYSNNIISNNYNAPLEPQPSSKPPVTDLMYFGAMLVVTFSILVLLIIFGCALFQRPKNKVHKGPQPTATVRTRSGTSSRQMNHTNDQCSAYCLGLTSL